MRALFVRVPRLVEDLAIARASGAYSSALAKLSRIDVLVLDDFLLAPMKDAERRDMLEVLEDRYTGIRDRGCAGMSDRVERNAQPDATNAVPTDRSCSSKHIVSCSDWIDGCSNGGDGIGGRNHRARILAVSCDGTAVACWISPVTISLELSDEAMKALSPDPAKAAAELRMAAAAKLFEIGRLSSGAAAELAGLPRVVFLAKLAELGVAVLRASEEDLADDLASV